MRDDYRHEIKHRIDRMDMFTIRSRLSAIATSDPHTINGKYRTKIHNFPLPAHND